MSSSRLDYQALAPKSVKALVQFTFAAGSSLDKRLKELVNLRVSQINGCALCMDMHWAELVKQGVEPRHLNALPGWREARRFFTERECAALNWAEAINASPHSVPQDADFEQVRRHFADAEIAELSFSVAAIRAWNMLNASFRTAVPEKPYVAG